MRPARSLSGLETELVWSCAAGRGMLLTLAVDSSTPRATCNPKPVPSRPDHFSTGLFAHQLRFPRRRRLRILMNVNTDSTHKPTPDMFPEIITSNQRYSVFYRPSHGDMHERVWTRPRQIWEYQALGTVRKVISLERRD